MFEKKFLAYILYITLLEIRESAYAEGNSRLYYLMDMLHNAPLSLLSDELAREEYKKVLQTVDELKISNWLNNRTKEFEERFPEYRDQTLLPAEHDAPMKHNDSTAGSQ